MERIVDQIGQRALEPRATQPKLEMIRPDIIHRMARVLRIVDQCRAHHRQIDRHGRLGIAVAAEKGEQRGDHRLHFGDIMPDRVARLRVRHPFATQPQPRERGAQIVPHRGERLGAVVDQRTDSRLHPVERDDHAAHLARAVLRHRIDRIMPDAVRRHCQPAQRQQRAAQHQPADHHQRDRGDQRQRDALEPEIEPRHRLERAEMQPAAVIELEPPAHRRAAPGQGQADAQIACAERRLPFDDLPAHLIQRGRDRRDARRITIPVDLVAIGGEMARHFGARARRAILDQPAADDEMLGEPPCLVVAHRKLARALIQQGRDAELDQHRQQQDRDDLPEQAGRGDQFPQRRSTGTLSI